MSDEPRPEDLLTIPVEIRDDFLDLVGRVAGEFWSRGGLERPQRSLITMAVLVARGLHDELAIHIRLAVEQFGLSREEVCEMIVQCALYAGFPAAVAAFRVATRVFSELDAEAGTQ